MAVETLAGEWASVVGPGSGLAGNTKTWFGRYNFGTVVVEDGDIRTVLKLPGQILVVGGELWTGDLDTGTETIDFDVGWTANGGGSATYTDSQSGYVFTNAGASADPDGFINSDLLTGDAIAAGANTSMVAAGINYRPVPLPTGPLYFSHETQVQFEVNAPAATPADAAAWLFLRYIPIF